MAGASAGMVSPQAPGAPDRRRMLRRLGIIAAIVLAVAGLIAVLLLIAPRHIARWVADSYLQDMQIDVEGVKTIDISLFNGEVSMGPVRFHAGTAEPGQIGLLGVKLSLGNLIQRQALLESVVVRDVEVTIRQTAEGDILINGVPLREILAQETAEQQQQQPPPDAEQQGGSSWGAGVDDMRVRNVQVTFINAEGGTARVTLDHVDLRGFRSWEADQPGTFVMTGDLNGIDVTAYGTARPFAEKITAQAEVAIDGIELRRIEEYTGPLGFAQTGGGLSIYSRGEAALFPDGRIEGDANTTMVLSNVDLADTARGAVKLDQGAIETNISYAMSEEGVLRVTGAGNAKLNQASAQPREGPALSLSSATVDLNSLELSRAPDSAMSIGAQLQLRAEQPAVSGPAALNADSLDVMVDPLAVDLSGAAGATSVTGAATTRISNGRLSIAGGDAGGSTDVQVETLEAGARELTLSLTPEKIDLATAVTLDTSRLAATLPPAEAGAKAMQGSIDTLSVQLPRVTVEAAEGRATLATSGEARLQKLAAARPPGSAQASAAFAVEDAVLGLRDLKAQTEADGALRADATIEATLQRLESSWAGDAATAQPAAAARSGRSGSSTARAAATTAAGAAGAAGRMRAQSLQVTLAPFGLRSAPAGGMQLSTSGSTLIEKVDATVPAGAGEAAFAVQLGNLRLAHADLSVQTGSGETSITGDIETSLAQLSASQPAPGATSGERGSRTALNVEAAQLALAPIEARTSGGQATVRAEGRAEIVTVGVELPRKDQKPALDASLAQLRANINQLQVEQSPGELAWQVALDSQASSLASNTEGGAAAAFKMQTLTVGGLNADHRQRLSIERVVLDRPEAFLTRAYLQGPAAAQESRPREAAEAVEEAAQEGWRFRLDSLGLAGDGTIRVRDTQVDPNTNFTLAIKALQVSNLDMGDPAQQTQMRMEGTINQFTELAVAGWAAPFGKQPDFDINARLNRLELPPLSPYAAQAVGVNVESGRLSVEATAAANAGNLNGEVDLTLRDLAFSALSPEEAQRLSSTIGVPVETIVGLLQDDEGRIRLSLPLAGDLASPSFGLGDAIRQALTGAIQAAVLAPFQLAFAPVSLLAEAASGGSGKGLAINPVPFDAGSATLNRTGADMLDGLARVLQEREKLKIKVCGRATAQDLQAVLAEEGAPQEGPRRAAAVEQLAPQLWSLAGERTANVREALNARGVEPNQVGECRILYNPDDTGPPRAEVGL